MTLDPLSRQNIINYRRERSFATFKEAEFVVQAQFWNLIANRLYYALFYMCEALLLSHGIPVNSHAGIMRMMSLHFVKEGKLSYDDGKLLSRLFRMRQTGDYNDLFYWTQEEILPLFPLVENLIHKIDALILTSQDSQESQSI